VGVQGLAGGGSAGCANELQAQQKSGDGNRRMSGRRLMTNSPNGPVCLATHA